ncbi:MAG: hypothetical protein WBN99_14675 [Mycobacterium sp.]
MRYIDASSPQRRRAVGAAFLAFWTIIVGAEWALLGTETAPVHGPHPLASSAVDAPVSVPLDHPHISQGGLAPLPESLAEAVLPRSTVTLITLALVSALAMLPAIWRYAAVDAHPWPSALTHRADRSRRARPALHRAALIG